MKKVRLHILFWLAVVFLAGCSGGGQEMPEKALPSCLVDIADCKIAVKAGTTQDMYLSDNYPEIEILRFPNISEVLTAVESGVADYAYTDSVYLLDLPSGLNDIEYKFTEGEGGDFGVAFNKLDGELCRQFNLFLSEIKENGTFDQLCDRWLTGKADSAPMTKQETGNDGDILKVGISPGYPFGFLRNDEWCGMECELMILFGEYANRKIVFDVYDFSALIPALSTKKVSAIVACITITEERQKRILFSAPYYHCADAVIGQVSVNKESTEAEPTFFQAVKEGFHNNLILENRWKMITAGLWETLIISFFSILLGTIIGGLICWLAMSRIKVLNIIAKVYVEILRDVPILVFLMIMFYVVFAHSSISATSVAIIAFALNFGAFVSVMFKTSIEGVGKGQTEAGLALGFSRLGTFTNFILPQALRSIVPVFKNEAVSLVKNTSIVGYIAIQDLTKASDIIRSRTFDAFFPLIVISIIYFILAWLIGKGLDLLLRRCEERKDIVYGVSRKRRGDQCKTDDE